MSVEPLTVDELQRYEANARRILDTVSDDTEFGRIQRALARETLNVAKTCRALLRDPKRVALEQRVKDLEEKMK